MALHTPSELRDRLKKRWDRGEFLAAVAPAPAPDDARGYADSAHPDASGRCPTRAFPLRVPLGSVSAGDLRHTFDRVRSTAAEYQALERAAGVTVEWTERGHRQLGTNRLPSAVTFDRAEALADFLGPDARRRLNLFRACAAELIQHLPGLAEWIRARPFALIDSAEDLDLLIRVSEWMVEHPSPGIYAREIPLEGIDTKFLERHARTLSEWWTRLLPADARVESKRFGERFGFRAPPGLVRFRVLDPDTTVAGFTDLTVPVAELCRPPFEGLERVYIVENDVTALAFPPVDKAIVMFGRGGAVAAYGAIAWLHDLPVTYWGDIDTHGFAILNRLRETLPEVRSMLMDRPTLLAHRRQWVSEPSPTRSDLPNLTEAEAALYDDVRENRLGHQVRLEQERVGFAHLERALADRS